MKEAKLTSLKQSIVWPDPETIANEISMQAYKNAKKEGKLWVAYKGRCVGAYERDPFPLCASSQRGFALSLAFSQHSYYTPPSAYTPSTSSGIPHRACVVDTAIYARPSTLSYACVYAYVRERTRLVARIRD